MDREHTPDELVELGVVTIDTKGSLATVDDEEGGFRPALGLTDD
jgi:hypothetical protein